MLRRKKSFNKVYITKKNTNVIEKPTGNALFCLGKDNFIRKKTF
jgi:hypothetical protein